jgi:eukaryotic-like serine/threonine-protein kinase
MASESVASFLNLARSHRLLQPEFVEDLARQSEAPQSNLPALCDFLQRRGVLTAFQANLVREGRSSELTFAGYPITGEIGPCPGGKAYLALHPSLRTPLVLRRLRTDWFAPADNAAAFVQRAQSAAPISHVNLTQLLDAGVYQDEAFIAQEPIEGENLFMLVQDIGAMPTPLAKLYIAQAANALSAIHKRGKVHGNLGPGTMVVGPLTPMSKRRQDGTPKMRPGPNAKLVVSEFGLVPRRPALSAWLRENSTIALEYAFCAPERLHDPEPTPEGDIYSLGASFYYLLAAYAPVPFRTNAELLDALSNGTPPSIGVLRQDLPAEIVQLIQAMMSRDVTLRPSLSTILKTLLGDQMPAEPAEPTEPEPMELSRSGSDDDVQTLRPASSPDDVAELEAVGNWKATPLSASESFSGLGTFTPESFDGSGTSSADLASLQEVKPDASWPGFPGGEPVVLPQAGWPGFAAPEAPGQGGQWSGHVIPEGIPAEHHPEPLHSNETEPAKPRVSRSEPVNKKNVWLWLGIGAGLQVIAILGWVYLAMSPGCHSAPAPNVPKKRG